MVEVVVVGAGFAGLAAAQVLGRGQREVLVLGSGPTRNAEAQHAHNVLTRDGTPPGELLRLAREEVAALPMVTLEDAHVTAVEPGDGEDLRVRLASGRAVDAEVVLLATGARDVLPDIPGLAALWGRRAHSCPYCDGEQYAGQRLVVIADEVKGAHLGGLLRGWTGRITVVDPSTVAAMEERGGEVVTRHTDGKEIATDGAFIGVAPVPRVDSVAGMALARRGPFLAVDGEGRTAHPRLWAAGDCSWRTGDASPGGQVAVAMAAGVRAGAFIIADRLGVHPPPPPPIDAPRAVSATAAPGPAR